MGVEKPEVTEKWEREGEDVDIGIRKRGEEVGAESKPPRAANCGSMCRGL